MARTYRNRRTVPKGWVVRDGNEPFCTSCCPNWETRRMKGRPYCGCYGGPQQRFRSRIWSKERKDVRKEHYKSYRAKVKDRMRHEEWENLPRFRRTSGWLTW